MSRFLDRFTESFRKKSFEEHVVAAFAERVSLTEEEGFALHTATDDTKKQEEWFRIAVRRMKSVMKDASITDKEIIKNYPAPLKAILLVRYLEKQGQERTTKLEEMVRKVGFRLIHNDVWVLPPSKTPQTLETDLELEAWLYENLTKTIYKNLQYVLPLVGLIDLRRVTAVKRGVRKKEISSTIFSVMELDEIVPPTYIYEYLKKKNLGLEEMMRSGSVVLLASAFNDETIVASVEQNRQDITKRIAQLVRKDRAELRDIAGLDEAVLARNLEGLMPHPHGVAHRLIIEAKYWDRFVSGGV